MGRFLLGIFFAFGLWWGYDRFFASAAQAAQPDDAPAVATQPSDFAAAGDGQGTAPPQPRGPVDAPESGDVIDAGPAEAAPLPEVSFAALRTLAGAERDRVCAALSRAVHEAATAEAAVAALGETNAFLHSAEGRKLAATVAARIAALPPREAVAASTALLEVAMSGAIEKRDAEARGEFDRLAAAHRRFVDRTVFDPADTTSARRYQVESGDTLVGIAKHLRKALDVQVEAGTLQIVNRISNPRALAVGQVLKCPVEPIRTVIRKDSFVVAVYVGPVLVRTYWCAHGTPAGADGRSHETPDARFVTGEKIENPDWHYEGRVIPFGDPANPLGTHFVRFDHESYSGFGIHGTNQPESIGTRASLGCIRLAQDDIVEFFRLVPRGSEVEIRS